MFTYHKRVPDTVRLPRKVLHNSTAGFLFIVVGKQYFTYIYIWHPSVQLDALQFCTFPVQEDMYEKELQVLGK